ncbi:valine--tRNA ligase, partial [Jeotgalibaca porci]
RFTLDDGLSDAVRKVFVTLYEKGLIYRGAYLINWDPKAQTALSDIEVIHKDVNGAFYHFRYPLADGSGFVELATTRPETMLGDTAVAVHPEDERYAHLIGKTILLPLVNREIPIIADDYVDKDFGTGVVKITPAHDPNDFEVGLRHNLPQINVMNKDASMNEEAGKYEGMDRFEARKAVVKDMEAEGFLVKIEEMVHSVGHSERTDVVVEPLISTQWFVKMAPLAEKSLQNQETDGKVSFFPNRFEDTFTRWMDNIHDWVISRQLWWGHRIPAWYHKETGEMYVGMEDPTDVENWEQDPDVLDTWFSSALWPFSTMGWPDENAEDFKRYFPTSTLVTGYDIISFWVSRMIFQSLEFTEQRPFENVLIHGLIRDEQGRKMSKSLGNGIDPMDVIDQYGADALRWFLSNGSSPGQDVRFSYEKMDASWNFINKIWNASRYVLMNLDGLTYDEIDITGEKTLADQWILSKLNRTIAKATELLEKFEFGEAGKLLYHFIWDEYCDWYIEMTKEVLQGEDEAAKKTARSILAYVLDNILRLLHPIMPFVTEEIWQNAPHEGESIVVAEYPIVDEAFMNHEAETAMDKLIGLIRGVRNIRNEMNTPLSKKVPMQINVNDDATENIFTANKAYIVRFCNPETLEIGQNIETTEEAVTAIISGGEVRMPLAGLIKLEDEIVRLEGEAAKLEKEVDRVVKKLGNERFVSKAPDAVVEGERAKEKDYREKLATVNERIASLKAQL